MTTAESEGRPAPDRFEQLIEDLAVLCDGPTIELHFAFDGAMIQMFSKDHKIFVEYCGKGWRVVEGRARAFQLIGWLRHTAGLYRERQKSAEARALPSTPLSTAFPIPCPFPFFSIPSRGGSCRRRGRSSSSEEVDGLSRGSLDSKASIPPRADAWTFGTSRSPCSLTSGKESFNSILLNHLANGEVRGF